MSDLLLVITALSGATSVFGAIAAYISAKRTRQKYYRDFMSASEKDGFKRDD